jgi:hypothetical protein
VAAGQLELTGGAQPIFVFSQILEKQVYNYFWKHKKYAQTTPLDDGVSSLFIA